MQNSSVPSDVLILGGGPSGMASAMELSKAGKCVTLIEKTSQVGGLARTLEFREAEGTYRTDIGPHRFFSKNRYLYDFIQDLLGEEWKKVQRLTRFYVDGQFYLYPIRMSDVFKKIGIVRACTMMIDYIWERARGSISPRPLRSFEDYAVSQFGRSLAEFNMLNYTEKIWGIPCSEISIDWAHQRIGGLTLWTTLKKMIMRTGGPKTLVDSFYYPSMGSGTIYEAIRKKIEKKGSTVLTESEPTKIHHDGKHVTKVEIKTQQGATSLQAKHVVSSIPITRLLELFEPAAPAEIQEAVRGLRFRSQAYLFLAVDKERIFPDNWVYFPDKEIPFGRLSEMKNFSPALCPQGKTSLFVEFFCFEGDEIWRASKEELFQKAIRSLEKLKILKKEEVLHVHHFKIAHVYPLYDLKYKERVQTVLKWLDSFDNFFDIGRPGRFRYTNQDHSLEMGILAAQSILTGQRMNVDDVGAEKEYFERGYVPDKK